MQMAQVNDMGVFIISPNDKGGQLFKAPEKVRKATAPLTPVQWNAHFCLQNPAVHTLTFGMHRPEHFEEMKGIFPVQSPWPLAEQKSKILLDSFVKDDAYAYYEGYDLQNDPSGIHIPQVLRLRKLWKCYDMKEYARYRYKIFEQKGHWFPGLLPTEENIAQIDTSKIPPNIPLKELLAETHRELFIPEYKLATE